MTIAKATQLSDAWNEIYNLLIGSSGLTDIRSPARTRSDWVFSAFPAVTGYGSSWYYPIVIIEPVNASTSEYRLNRGKRKITYNFRITIYAKKAADADTLIDDVKNILEGNISSLSDSGLNQMVIGTASFDNLEIEGNVVHARTLGVQFEGVN